MNYIHKKQLLENAVKYGRQRYLIVDYYRIRRRLALPLPIKNPLTANFPLRDYRPAAYPWSIWLTWALEERIETLGYAAEWSRDSLYQKAASQDLEALAQWPTHRTGNRPDLSFAHSVRVLWVALRNWTWLDDSLRDSINRSLYRAVDDVLPFSNQLHGKFENCAMLLESPEPHAHLHNIPLIGTIAAALAADISGHEAAPLLDNRVDMLFTAVLELRKNGFTEGVSYDGYVLSFLADWLASRQTSDVDRYFAHPAFAEYFNQSALLSAPGNVAATAELGDVEPQQMPFHLSAFAKLQTLRYCPQRAWLLQRCSAEILRADALAALSLQSCSGAVESPPVGAQAVRSAVVLRSGYEADDLAVAISASNSPMGHIQCDNGSLVIGSLGRWWITDPGYQQYLKTKERDFTTGPTAHNSPIINGYAQTEKSPQRMALKQLEEEVYFTQIDLTTCYPGKVALNKIYRSIFLLGREFVVVCDHIEADKLAQLQYHWHGHSDLAWWVQQGTALLHAEDAPQTQLWLFSPQLQVQEADIDRLPGSRGQLTLVVDVPATELSSGGTQVWWVFAFAAERPAFTLDWPHFFIGSHQVNLNGLVPDVRHIKKLLSDTRPGISSLAYREGNHVFATCPPGLGNGELKGNVEYAFYLHANGQRINTQWYTPESTVCFELPQSAQEIEYVITAFVRDTSGKKFSIRVKVD